MNPLFLFTWAHIKQNHVRAVVADVPHGLSILPLLMSLDCNLEDPGKGITEWPNWHQLLQCSAEDAADHPWCTHSQDQPAQLDHLKDKLEEVTEKVDKGKGQAEEVSYIDPSLSQPTGAEVRWSQCHGHGHGQTTA